MARLVRLLSLIAIGCAASGAAHAQAEPDDYAAEYGIVPEDPAEEDATVTVPRGDEEDAVVTVPRPAGEPGPPPADQPVIFTLPGGEIQLQIPRRARIGSARPADGTAAPPPLPAPAPPSGGMLAAPAPYAKVRVGGERVSEFYYVRQDHFQALDASNVGRLLKVVSSNAFGPHPVGASVKVRAGSNYFFFPVCNDQLSWRRKALKPIEEGGPQNPVSLACPT